MQEFDYQRLAWFRDTRSNTRLAVGEYKCATLSLSCGFSHVHEMYSQRSRRKKTASMKYQNTTQRPEWLGDYVLLCSRTGHSAQSFSEATGYGKVPIGVGQLPRRHSQDPLRSHVEEISLCVKAREGNEKIQRTIVYSSNADNSKVFDVWAAFAEQYPNVKRSHFCVKKNVTCDELLNTDNCGFDDVYAFVDRADANVKIPEEVIAYNEVIESLTISELGEDDMFDEMQRNIDEWIIDEMNPPQDEAAGSDENE